MGVEGSGRGVGAYKSNYGSTSNHRCTTSTTTAKRRSAATAHARARTRDVTSSSLDVQRNATQCKRCVSDARAHAENYVRILRCGNLASFFAPGDDGRRVAAGLTEEADHALVGYLGAARRLRDVRRV